MASCVLCASLQVNNHSDIRFTTRNDAQSHAAQHLLQMKRLDDANCSSLDQAFDQCFPKFGVTPAWKQKRIVIKKEGRQSLLNFCHTVFKGRVSRGSPRMPCQKCGSEIVIYCGQSGGHHFELAINHASVHLGIDLFECRKCGCSFSNKKTLCGHLRATHGLSCCSEHFTDNSGDYIDEIITSIEQCFTEGNNLPSDEKARVLRFKDETRVRSKTKGSKLAVERQLLCYHLIRQLEGDDGKIQCHLCSKRIDIKQVGGYQVQYALGHANVHLKKPLFRCKVCMNILHTRHSLQFHLKSVHALPLMNNYDSVADEFHAEILDILRKCYGEEPGK